MIDLERIKQICETHRCEECPFSIRGKSTDCEFVDFPNMWDVDHIREVLKDEKKKANA